MEHSLVGLLWLTMYVCKVGFKSVSKIIGMGVFSLPYAFYVGGVSLASLSTLLFSFLLVITAFYVLEIMARAQGFTVAQQKATFPKNKLLYGVTVLFSC